VKIRCRSRRTLSSQARQSTASQSRIASSGPFATATAVASNLSFGSGALVIFSFTGSPDRVSPLSRPGTRPGIRPVMRDGGRGGQPYLSRFPVAFRPPAFASRSSDTRRGVGPSLRSAYRTRRSGPRRGYHVAHAQDATGLGASCTPGAVVLSWPAHITSQRLPLFGGQPLHPVPATLINGVPNDEASTEV